MFDKTREMKTEFKKIPDTIKQVVILSVSALFVAVIALIMALTHGS